MAYDSTTSFFSTGDSTTTSQTSASTKLKTRRSRGNPEPADHSHDDFLSPRTSQRQLNTTTATTTSDFNNASYNNLSSSGHSVERRRQQQRQRTSDLDFDDKRSRRHKSPTDSNRRRLSIGQEDLDDDFDNIRSKRPSGCIMRGDQSRRHQSPSSSSRSKSPMYSQRSNRTPPLIRPSLIDEDDDDDMMMQQPNTGIMRSANYLTQRAHDHDQADEHGLLQRNRFSSVISSYKHQQQHQHQQHHQPPSWQQQQQHQEEEEEEVPYKWSVDENSNDVPVTIKDNVCLRISSNNTTQYPIMIIANKPIPTEYLKHLSSIDNVDNVAIEQQQHLHHTHTYNVL